MSAAQIIAKVAEIGGTIRATPAGMLTVKPPAGGLPPALLQSIRDNKPDLLALLSPERQAPPARGIDPAKRRDVIGEQPNPAAYEAWLLSSTGRETRP